MITKTHIIYEMKTKYYFLITILIMNQNLY
jgi:hypothetical protein